MKLIFIILLLTGCGSIDVSDSKHEIGGEATIRVVIGIDLTACEGLPPEDKLECVQGLIDLAKLLTEQDEQLKGFGGI